MHLPVASYFLISICVNSTVFQEEEPCNRYGRIVPIADTKSTRNFNSHTLANAIIKLLPDYVKFQQLINETLHSQLPKHVCKKVHRIAIDLILIPYHGEHQYRIEEVYRSQLKSGTSHFHAYATAYIVHLSKSSNVPSAYERREDKEKRFLTTFVLYAYERQQVQHLPYLIRRPAKLPVRELNRW